MKIAKNSYKVNGKKRETANYYIRFKDHTGAWHRIPAFTNKALSEALGKQIDHLVNSKDSGIRLDAQSVKWIEDIPAKLRTKLEAIGLLDPWRAMIGKPLAVHLKDFKSSSARSR